MALDWIQAFAAVATIIDVCLILGGICVVIGVILVACIEVIDPE